MVFHLIVMPLMGLTPGTFHLPLDEDLSEAFGHVVWLWSAELIRRDLRSRITHGPDASIAPTVPEVEPSVPETPGDLVAA